MPVETKRHPAYKGAKTKKRLPKIKGTKIVKKGKSYKVGNSKGVYREGT